MGKYDFVLDLETDNSLRWINECLTDYSTILEFGPANGRLTRHLKENRHCIVDIVEIDSEAGNEASEFARSALLGSDEGNIETYVWLTKFKNNKYDFIIFADVLEHLYNPELVLEKSKGLLSKNGRIVFSIPNIAYNGLILNLLRDRFEYTHVGLLDNTHIRFFTYNSILELVKRLNMFIVFQSATQSQVGANEVTGRYEFFNNFDSDIIRSHPYGEVYQFIFAIQCTPGDVIDKLKPISQKIEEKYTNYVNPNQLLSEKTKLLDEILNSKIWRITAPLRFIGRFFRNC